MKEERIYLSPPHQTGDELEEINKVIQSNWLAPVGPELKSFESAICEATGFKYAVATSSGTAALHLGLIILGVGQGDKVLTNSMTFAGGVNPIIYQGGEPIFIDSQTESWNIDPYLMDRCLKQSKNVVKAIVPAHLYGMPADVSRLEALGRTYQVPLLHDLAECLAGRVGGSKIGQKVARGILSFNGNKLVTTSGGGAYVTNSKEEAEKALYLATQAKSDEVAYHHEAVGYNYRLSNVLAALGLAQINHLDEKVRLKKQVHEIYRQELAGLGIEFQENINELVSDRWLTTILLDSNTKVNVMDLIQQMNAFNIELRPLWKPMHLQPVFANELMIEGKVSEDLFNRGICLPSGCGLSESQQSRVIDHLKLILRQA